MIAPRRWLVVLASGLAIGGAIAACGDSGGDGSGGNGAGGAGNGDGDGGASGGARADGGGGPDSAAERSKDAAVVDEQPSTDNQVLLGAVFFGEQPADFGLVAPGGSRTMAFTIRNLAQTRTILGTSIAGDHAGDFSVDPGTCGDATELAGGASCTLRVTFAPTAAGERRASLRLAVDPGVGAGRSLRGGSGSTPTTTETTTTTETRDDERDETQTQPVPERQAAPPQSGGVEG